MVLLYTAASWTDSLPAPIQRGLPPKYLVDVILRPQSASSCRTLRSSDRFDLLIPRRTDRPTLLSVHPMLQLVHLSLWNDLSSSVCCSTCLLVSVLTLPFSEPTSSHGGTGSASEHLNASLH